MNKTVLRFAQLFWPDINSLGLARQLVIVGDIFTGTYFFECISDEFSDEYIFNDNRECYYRSSGYDGAYPA